MWTFAALPASQLTQHRTYWRKVEALRDLHILSNPGPQLEDAVCNPLTVPFLCRAHRNAEVL